MTEADVQADRHKPRDRDGPTCHKPKTVIGRKTFRQTLTDLKTDDDRDRHILTDLKTDDDRDRHTLTDLKTDDDRDRQKKSDRHRPEDRR